MTPVTSIYEYAKHSLTVSADKPAIWFRDKAMTYRTMFRRIDDLAANLARLGVKMGTVVTIHLPNCPQAVMTIYAVAKLGGICNMVHHLMPAEALARYMAFAESTILISTDRKLLDSGIADTAIYVDVDSYMDDFAFRTSDGRIVDFAALVHPAAVPAAIPDQKELAEKCVVYMHSSGTTGTPKTVMLSNRAVNACVESMKTHYGIGKLYEQICLWISPLYHCLGYVGEMHRALGFGGQLLIMERWNSDTAVDMIKKYKVTHFVGVPSLYRDLLRNPGFCGKEIQSLTYLFAAGEPVPAELILDLDERVGKGPVTLCAYGLTETCGPIIAHSHRRRKETSSGYPLDNTQVMLLDADENIWPTGQGELIVYSDAMMLGYLKDPTSTAESYVRYDGKMWLKTGDFGGIDEDGYVSVINRMKDIIIRKGNNIFPDEIEGIIRKIPGVAEACVIGVADEENATQAVCAVVVPQPDAEKSELRTRILTRCREDLLPCAIPTKVIMKDLLPRNKMGKVDRKALQEVL